MALLDENPSASACPEQTMDRRYVSRSRRKHVIFLLSAVAAACYVFSYSSFSYSSSSSPSIHFSSRPITLPTKRQLKSRNIPYRRQQRSQSDAFPPVRYLAFGSQSTWGMGLEEQAEAYPYLLSPLVHNAATRQGGPALSAACTQSIVGDDDVYDVVLLEFLDRAEEGLLALARRVRQRFPNATIVFVRLWSPNHVYYTNESGLMTPLMEWRGSMALHGPEFAQAIRESDHSRWYLNPFTEQEAIIRQAVAEVKGFLYTLPGRGDKNIVEALLSHSNYFTEDQELSPIAHELVHKGVSEIVEQQKIADRTDRDAVGSWGSGDACNVWYSTGELATSAHRRTKVAKISSDKYALEIPKRGGRIKVTNPFEEDRMLHLTYMTAWTAPKGRKVYPRTRVSLAGKKTVIIDPILDAEGDNHRTRTTAVGYIRPGESEVRLDALEGSLSRFRLVGASILGNIADAMPIEFNLQSEPAEGVRQSGFLW